MNMHITAHINQLNRSLRNMHSIMVTYEYAYCFINIMHINA